jgi:hypothetical protein
MTGPHVIEVPLPANVRPTQEDVELLRVTFQAIAGMRYESGREWENVLRHLESEGWTVRCGLNWHVEARRGRELEEACGTTRDEAFTRLNQITRVESVEGCP